MTSKISIDNRELLQKISTGEAAAGIDFGNAIVRELAAFRLAAMDSEPVRNPVLAYADSYRDMAKQGVESVPIWSVITDLERNIAPLYRHAQPAQTGVDDDVRNIIGLLETNEWAEHCTETVLGSRLEAEITRLVGSAQPAPVVPAEKTMPNPLSMYAVDAVAAIAEVKGWNACRATMLQAGNSPVIPEGYVMVPKEPTDEMIAAAMNCDDVLFNSDESFCVQFGNIYEAMIAAAPQEVQGE